MYLSTDCVGERWTQPGVSTLLTSAPCAARADLARELTVTHREGDTGGGQTGRDLSLSPPFQGLHPHGRVGTAPAPEFRAV